MTFLGPPLALPFPWASQKHSWKSHFKKQFFLLSSHNFFQMHPQCKIWVCFDKFRKFAAKWAQEFTKLIEKWLRKLSLKLATPSRKEKYLQLSVYLSKLGSFWSILDREQNVAAGGIWFCIPKWTLCRWVCTSQLWYYEILKCNKHSLFLDRFSWWPCMFGGSKVMIILQLSLHHY